MTMRKQANLVELAQQAIQSVDPAHVGTMAGTWVAGDTLLGGLRHLGKKNSPELFTTAYEYGKQGKQINLHTRNMMHTALGRKNMQAIDEGRRLGEYMKKRGLSPKEEEHYLRQIHAAGKQRSYTPYHHDLGQMLDNQLNEKSMVQRLAERKPDPVTKKPGVAHVAQDIGLATIAPVTDFRMATRPAFRYLDQTKLSRAVGEKMKGDGAVKRTANGIKDYIS